jgi:hypothetical protein
MICALLGYYAAYGCNYLLMFGDNVSVPSSRVIFKGQRPLTLGKIGCPETSVRNYHHMLRNITEERSSHLPRGGSLKLCSSFYVYDTQQ